MTKEYNGIMENFELIKSNTFKKIYISEKWKIVRITGSLYMNHLNVNHYIYWKFWPHKVYHIGHIGIIIQLIIILDFQINQCKFLINLLAFLLLTKIHF